MTLRGGQSNGSIRTWRRHFPLTSVDSVVELMEQILGNSGFSPSRSDRTTTLLPGCNRLSTLSDAVSITSDASFSCVIEPDLTFVSLILGYIENHLTYSTQNDLGQLRSKSTSTHSPHATPPLARSRPSSHNSSSSSSTTTTSTTTPVPQSPELSSQSSTSPNVNLRTTTASRRSSRSARQTQRQSTTLPHRPHHSGGGGGGGGMPPSPLCTTSYSSASKRRRFSESDHRLTNTPNTFPSLSFDEVDRWYQEFHTLIMTSTKLKKFIKAPNSKSTKSDRSAIEPNTTDGSLLEEVVQTPGRFATRSLLRAVCEVLWTRMSTNRGREKLTHTQSIYAFLTIGILDSFGLAYTTVAACQLLGYPDVQLALSEDHGWVEFGPTHDRQTADVASWAYNICHPDTNDQSVLRDESSRGRRGVSPVIQTEQSSMAAATSCQPPPIRQAPLTHSWLYVNGQPVVCTPCIITVVAAVAALQPGAAIPSSQASAPPRSAPVSSGSGVVIDEATTDAMDLVTPDGLARHLSSSPTISMQLVNLKHRLLWLFYSADCLARYPLSLTNLADLEDAFPSIPTPPSAIEDRPSDTSSLHDDPIPLASPALRLYEEAVRVTRTVYRNQHVYPYTSLAGYLYRHDDHRGSLRFWAEAAQVIGQYNHSSEDSEIYRELLHIATQLMPHVFRTAADALRNYCDGRVVEDPDGYLYQPSNLLDDPQCLAFLLTFYDHLCLWEEDSVVPVLHVGWVDKLMVNLIRFTPRARRLLSLTTATSGALKTSTNHSPTVSIDSTANRSDALASPSVSVLSSSRRSTRRTRTSSLAGVDDASIPTGAPNTPSSASMATVCDSSPVLSGCNPLPPQDQASAPVDESLNSAPPPSPTVDRVKDEHVDYAGDVEVQETHLKHNDNNIQSVDQPTPSAPESQLIKNTNPVTVVDVLTHLYQDSVGPELTTEPDDQDASPSPPAVDEFPSCHDDDLLTNLAEACDHRLLNPAFLWGLDPDRPFLPDHISVEAVFARLLAATQTATRKSAEQQQLQQQHQQSLFPTPPNSGNLYGTVVKSDQPTQIEATPDDYPQNTRLQPNTLSDNYNEVYMENDIDDASSDEVPDALIDSVVELVEHQESIHGHMDSKRSRERMNEDLEQLLKADESIEVDEEQEEEHNGAKIIPDVKEARDITKPLSVHTEPDMINEQCVVNRGKTMADLTIHLTLHSYKMISIVELLRASRLNGSAIKLALTAQSQVRLRRTGLPSVYYS